MTFTVAEYHLLKPGLERLANGLTTARLGFSSRAAIGRVHIKTAALYANKAFDEEMAQRVLGVRRMLWEMTESKRIRIDEFEICALALALRLNRQPRFAPERDILKDSTATLAKKLERFRKRAKAACVKRFGSHGRHEIANRWKAYVAWTRCYALTASLPTFGHGGWRTEFWRKQREELTQVLARVLDENFYEPLNVAEMAKMVTLAASTYHRGRRAVGLRQLLKAPGEHTQSLLKFVIARAALQKRADAPKSLCERQAENGERIRASMARRYPSPISDASSGTKPPVQPNACATAGVQRPPAIRHSDSTPPSEATPSNGSPLWNEWLWDFIGQWFLRCVDPMLRRQVCEQAHYLIGHDLLDQFRRTPTTAKSFNSLFTECRPGPEGEPINWSVNWVLTSLLVLGRSPSQCYTDVQLGFGRAMKIRRP